MFILSFLAAAQLDALADLTSRSADLRSFTAVYELTNTVSPGTTQIRIDYVAPARVRVDRTSGDLRATTWCVDGVLAMTGRDEKGDLQGRADSALACTELDPIEKALHAAFPKARPPAAHAAAVGMRWSFDNKTQQTNFSIVPQLALDSPLGWLATLKQKAAVAREDGELLRFETDGAFQIAISKQNGFLQQFAGESPKGEMHVALVSLELNKGVDASRFALPPQIPAARDITPDLTRMVTRDVQDDWRRRLYQVIAGADAPAVWDAAFLAKINSVIRPFYADIVPKTFAATFEEWNTIRENVTKDLLEMRKAGKSDEEVEQKRQRELGYLNKQLDKKQQSLETGLALPAGTTDLPRAKELLALEIQAVSDAYRSKVREPVLAAFETATKK